jgi:hypothetical protein
MAAESLSLRSLMWFGLSIGVAYAAIHVVQRALGFSTQRAWVVVWSVGWILMSLAMLWKGEFPVGIMGREPSHVSRGVPAVIIALLALALGVAALLRSEALAEAMRRRVVRRPPNPLMQPTNAGGVGLRPRP